MRILSQLVHSNTIKVSFFEGDIKRFELTVILVVTKDSGYVENSAAGAGKG